VRASIPARFARDPDPRQHHLIEVPASFPARAKRDATGPDRTLIDATLVAALCLSVPGAKAEDAKYPNWVGLSRAARRT
jgi:hypothetical protein